MTKPSKAVEEIKKKDWNLDQWKNSKDPLDRLVWFIGSLSPHNYWRGRQELNQLVEEERDE